MVVSKEEHRILPAGALPCVWMSAGLVAYRLCDREFDCDGCPLDAALRGGTAAAGDPVERPAVRAGRRAAEFPEDRRYSTGHLWVQALDGDGEGLRVGLDGFASHLIAGCVAVHCGAIPRQLSDGELLCEIELAQGALPIAAPFSCRMLRWNGALAGDPTPVWTDPYGAGWIADVDADGGPAPDGLLTAAEARKQAELDLRGFRRRAALYLLADTAEVGTCLADGGRMITDMRQLLGKERYLQLLREMTA